MTKNTAIDLEPALVMTPEDLLEHWQGHRRLSRKMIEAFPEKELFGFSIGGMRTYAELALEMIGIAEGGINGIATGDWQLSERPIHHKNTDAYNTKVALLDYWDKITNKINTFFPQIAPQRWQENDKAFGQYEGPVWSAIFYFIDNEIHHRGQGYVYLRALGNEPPAFWDRQ